MSSAGGRVTPRQRVLAECECRGVSGVVVGCMNLLDGRTPVDLQLIAVLGGEAAHDVLSGKEGGPEGYWPRVWAARGLLYAWDADAVDVIAAACADDAWRVREMAAKVIARHRLDEAVDQVIALRNDEFARVRAAAERALQTLVPGDTRAFGVGSVPGGRRRHSRQRSTVDRK